MAPSVTRGIFQSTSSFPSWVSFSKAPSLVSTSTKKETLRTRGRGDPELLRSTSHTGLQGLLGPCELYRLVPSLPNHFHVVSGPLIFERLWQSSGCRAV
jgi:hypothetical protein